MEDISRELEREIARAKPAPHKTSRKRRVLVVDDYGEMKSGTYLKVLVRFLAVTTLFFGLATVGLYVLYDRILQEHVQMKDALGALEGKTKKLSEEKELLMARLVMAGEKPILQTAETSEDPAQTAKDAAPPSGEKKAEAEVAGKSSGSAAGPGKVAETDRERLAADSGSDDQVEGLETSDQEGETEGPGDQIGQAEDSVRGEEAEGSGLVRVEKFSLSKIPDRDELRVRFNIRNIKKGPGEISGRIFLVLKPSSGTEDDWIVVPKAAIKDGAPADFKRGQYFSISRFKPVRFTIKSPSNFQDLSSAAVYIFSDEGQIIYKDLIEITVDEEN